MNRRDSIGALLALCSAGSPLYANSQPLGKIWRIGALSPWNKVDSAPYNAEIDRGMLEAGLVDGKDFKFEVRYAEGQGERLVGFAGELVRLGVDIILADSTNSAIAAHKATTSIPIVFSGVGGDPVALGFAESLARPGGNMTGMTNFSGDLQPKRLELLKQSVPKLSRVAWLANPANSYFGSAYLQRARTTSDALGLQAVHVTWNIADDIRPVFEKIVREGAQALIVGGDAFHYQKAKIIADAAIKYRIPSIAPFREFTKAGVLLSYGTNPFAQYRYIAGNYLAKVIRGAKPGDLPIEQPSTFEMVVNLRTATVLGLTIPQELLLRADEAIE